MANKLKNCPDCGKIFVDTGVGKCRDCLDKEEEIMLEVSSYVRDHPNSKVKEICEALNVKEKIVMKMIREGRFVTEGVSFEYPCAGGCGRMITQDKYCEQCKEEMQKKAVEAKKKLEKAVAAKAKQAAPKPAGAGMYSKDMGLKTR